MRRHSWRGVWAAACLPALALDAHDSNHPLGHHPLKDRAAARLLAGAALVEQSCNSVAGGRAVGPASNRR